MNNRNNIILKVVFDATLSESDKLISVSAVNDLINSKDFLLYFYTGDTELNVITLAGHLISIFETADGYYANVEILDTPFGKIINEIIDTYFNKDTCPLKVVLKINQKTNSFLHGFIKI